MAESLFDVVSTTLRSREETPLDASPTTLSYLDRLSSLNLSALTSTESDVLQYDSQTSLRSLQGLSKRSYQSIDTADEALSNLRTNVPAILGNASSLQSSLPQLESQATRFSSKYNRLSDNAVLEQRKRVLRLGDNVDRLSDVLELPTLLASVIAASSQAATSQVGSTSSANANYATALDLHAHIRRLQRLYPDSDLIKSIAAQAEHAMRDMTSSLISTLRSQSLKLAGGMRLVGLLRRVAPELDEPSRGTKGLSVNAGEASLGAMFLVCRLSNLLNTLEALEPLKDLADQDFSQSEAARERNPWAAGQQTERYLKRYIEVFREQCFSVISMYKSIFPGSLPGPGSDGQSHDRADESLSPKINGAIGGSEKSSKISVDPLQQLPPALSTFTLHLVDMLMETLRVYLPNVRDQASRDSLLTQVLYCSASLGRLGGDFSMMLALLEEDVNEAITEKQVPSMNANDTDSPVPQWVQAMQRHRDQASRLSSLASGASRRAMP